MIGPLIVLTDRTQVARPLLDVVAAAIDGGARTILLREKDLPQPNRARLATALRRRLADVDGALLVASDPAIPADGLHLAASDPFPGDLPGGMVVGRSCHARQDLAAAVAEGCHHATLSPIFATASKPGHGPALGPAMLADTPLPTYALGGVDPSNAPACLQAGAAGVAVMGAVMRAAHPDRVVAALIEAITTVAPAHPANTRRVCDLGQQVGTRSTLDASEHDCGHAHVEDRPTRGGRR